MEIDGLWAVLPCTLWFSSLYYSIIIHYNLHRSIYFSLYIKNDKRCAPNILKSHIMLSVLTHMYTYIHLQTDPISVFIQDLYTNVSAYLLSMTIIYCIVEYCSSQAK